MVLMTFVPASKRFAMVIAMPGGLLVLAWMIGYSIRLYKLALVGD